MADLVKIFTGMSNGPEDIDKNFNALNSDVGGVKSSLQWSASTNAGLVGLDGLEVSGESYYTYAKIGNRKIIDLYLNLKRTTQTTGPNGGRIQWPSAIQSNAMMSGSVNSQDCRWVSDGTGITLTTVGTGKDHGWNPGTIYSIHMFYTVG